MLAENFAFLGMEFDASSIDVNNLRLIEFLLIEASNEEVVD